MTATTEALEQAAFPEGYGDILTEVLKITPSRLSRVKDALYHFRSLDDGQAQEVIAEIAQAHEEAAYREAADDLSNHYREEAERQSKLAQECREMASGLIRKTKGDSFTTHEYRDIANALRRLAVSHDHHAKGMRAMLFYVEGKGPNPALPLPAVCNEAVPGEAVSPSNTAA